MIKLIHDQHDLRYIYIIILCSVYSLSEIPYLILKQDGIEY